MGFLPKLLNPIKQAKGAFNAVTHPLQTARNAISNPMQSALNPMSTLQGSQSKPQMMASALSGGSPPGAMGMQPSPGMAGLMGAPAGGMFSGAAPGGAPPMPSMGSAQAPMDAPMPPSQPQPWNSAFGPQPMQNAPQQAQLGGSYQPGPQLASMPGAGAAAPRPGGKGSMAPPQPNRMTPMPVRGRGNAM